MLRATSVLLDLDATPSVIGKPAPAMIASRLRGGPLRGAAAELRPAPDPGLCATRRRRRRVDPMLFNCSAAAETVTLTANHGRLTFFRDPGNVTMDTDNVETSTSTPSAGPTASR